METKGCKDFFNECIFWFWLISFTEVLDRMVQIKNNNDNDICFEIEKKNDHFRRC